MEKREKSERRETRMTRCSKNHPYVDLTTSVITFRTKRPRCGANDDGEEVTGEGNVIIPPEAPDPNKHEGYTWNLAKARAPPRWL